MAKVVLASKVLIIAGELQERQVSPSSAKISSGQVEFGNYGLSDIEEYRDLRGGLGKDSEERTSNRFAWANGVETIKEGLWTLGPLVTTAGAFASAPYKIIDFENITYGLKTADCYYWDTGTSGWVDTLAASPLATPTDAITFKDASDGYLVVCNGTAVTYCSVGLGGSEDWVELKTKGGTGDSMPIHKMCVFDQRLIGVDATGTTLYYSVSGDINDSTTGYKTFSLSGPYSACNKVFVGKTLTTGEPCIYMLTPEGLFIIDFWTHRIYAMEVRFSKTAEARVGDYWNGSIIIGTGSGMCRLTPNAVDPSFGPNADDGLPEDYTGYIYDMVTTNEWVIIAVAGGTYDTILKRHMSVGGWHHVYSSASAIEHLCYSPASTHASYDSGRLWFQDGTNIKYIEFPDTTHDVTKVTGYPFCADGILELTRMSRVSVIPKIAIAVEGLTEDLNADEKVTISYKLDNDADWTELGEMTTSPNPRLDFASYVGARFYDCQLKAKLERGDTTTNTPKVKALALKYLVIPARVTAWSFTLRALGKRAKEIINFLYDSYDATTLLTFSPDGDLGISTKYVRIATLPSRKWLDKYADKRQFEVVVSEVE